MVIVSAFGFKNFTSKWWLILVVGILTFLFSLMIITHPIVGVFSTVVWTGASLFVFGISLMALAFVGKD